MKNLPAPRYTRLRCLFTIVLMCGMSIIINIPALGAYSIQYKDRSTFPQSVNRTNEDFSLYLPIVIKGWPPYPDTATLNPIDNSDQDNHFTVSWQNLGVGGQYILEESTEPSFFAPNIVYQGPDFTWEVQVPGKLPGFYYYRVKTINQFGESNWSETQGIRIYPLYVGLQVRWDGSGFIRGSDIYDVGYHTTKVFGSLTDADTIRGDNRFWYDPDPWDFGGESYTSYYSVTTGEFISSNSIDDPSWKWGYSWKLSYVATYQNDTTVKIDGQDFTVTGPHSGYTSFGTPIQYWEFVNQDKFLYWDGGGEWKQYVEEGDARLRYDAGESRLLIYRDIKRRYYYDGDATDDTVQYIIILSAATSLPGSPPVVLSNSEKQLGEQKGCAFETCPRHFLAEDYKK